LWYSNHQIFLFAGNGDPPPVFFSLSMFNVQSFFFFSRSFYSSFIVISWDSAVRSLTVSAEPVIAIGTHAIGDRGIAGCCLLSSPSLGRLLAAWCPSSSSSSTTSKDPLSHSARNTAAAVVNLAVLLNRLDDDGE
jgi:hypothetical protein